MVNRLRGSNQFLSNQPGEGELFEYERACVFEIAQACVVFFAGLEIRKEGRAEVFAGPRSFGQLHGFLDFQDYSSKLVSSNATENFV